MIFFFLNQWLLLPAPKGKKRVTTNLQGVGVLLLGRDSSEVSCEKSSVRGFMARKREVSGVCR